MKIFALPSSLLIAATLALAPAAGEDWPQWRGPLGSGVSPETDLPVRWSAEENVAWKAALGGLGVSNPVVFGDRVYVTSQLGRGVLREGTHPTLARGEEAPEEASLGGTDSAAAGGEGDVQFLVEAYRRTDGERLWQYRLAAEGKLPEVHRKANMASPSPVTDGERVYVWFATGQLIALDVAGELVWERHLAKEYSPFEIVWGHASSPTLYRDSLLLLCDHEPKSYLLALDKRTGRERWKVDRGQGLRSYSTPLVVYGPDRDELIVNSSERMDAYRADTGEWLWKIGEPNRFPVPSPSYADGVLYTSRGYRSGPYMAIRTGGQGDVSETHLLWKVETGAPYISSLVYYRGQVYMANGNGIVTSVDGESGKRLWQERIGGVFTASPVAGDGKVYFVAESGETVVVAAGPELEVLARNRIGERSLASPAISRGQIFLRTDDHLFCIGERSDEPSPSGP